MSLQLWLAFAAATIVVLVIPGPTILLVLSYSLAHGRRLALPIVAGVALGDLTAMSVSMVGLGAVLLASATLFTALKWIGALYLIYLGIRLFRAEALPVAEEDTSLRPRRVALHVYAVTALNPKSIAFFVAFVPQFIDRNAPYPPQAAVMIATFVALAGVNAGIVAHAASSARAVIRRGSVQRLINRTGGSLLIGAGLLTLAWRRSAT